MKKIIVLIPFFLIIITGAAQTVAKTFSTKTPVTIVSWGNRSVYQMKGYWEMATPQLEKKFSKNLADSIKSYTSEIYYPTAFTHSLENEKATPNKNDLKMYLVGTFDNNFNGSFHGVIDVIWVPRAENNNWTGATVLWDRDFFMLFPKEAVAVKK